MPDQYSPAHSTFPGTATRAWLDGGCQPGLHQEQCGSVLPATIVSSRPTAAKRAGKPEGTTPPPDRAVTVRPPERTDTVTGTP